MGIVKRWKQNPAQGLDFTPTAEHRNRIWWVNLAFFIGCAAILLRLGHLHLTPSAKLSEEDARHVGRMNIEIPRGEIFDRNGLVLATSTEVPSIFVDPRRVEEPLALTNYISMQLGIPEDDVLDRLARTDAQGRVRKMNTIKRWVTDVSERELAALKAFSNDAVIIQNEPVRYYPHGDSASHLLGFVNRAGEASEGLELAFDQHLRSESGVLLARKDHGRRLLPSGLLAYEAPRGGEMVQLTLDINIQHTLEGALDQRMEEVGAAAGLGIIMEVHSGAILALASRPAFDPNQYDAYPAEMRKNRALLDVFEPGSVFKIVTGAAALEHGLVTPETLINCENGSFNPYGHRIRDFYRLGVVPFQEAFEQSSNIAFIKLAALLGAERLEEWIRLFGFGERTSPDFRFESRGLFRPRNEWSRLSMGSLPMGQEIAVTMPQLAKSMAVIANGGYVVQPYFVEHAVTQQGEVTYQYQAPPPQRILSAATAKTMQHLCHQVVLNGTGRAANIQEYRAGGKTGTAQMARTDGRGYDPDRYTTVFAGFAPVADPRLVGVIVIQEPTNDRRYGGFVCGPVFKEVMRDALIRLNVPEDPVIDPDAPEKDVSQMAARKEKDSSKKATVDTVRTGNIRLDVDTIVAPPNPDDLDMNVEALLTSLDGLELVARRMAVDPSEQAMPDLRGMTKRQARDTLQALELLMDAQGVGWVISQDPPPGAALDGVSLCALRFGDRMAVENDADSG